MAIDPPIPGYLGRVLSGTGEPVGTCFQVIPGVLVTALHVLTDLGAGHLGATVSVDALAASQTAVPARVTRVAPLHDLAVMCADEPLPSCVTGLFATDTTEVGTPVVVTGVAEVDDHAHKYRHLDARAEWAGGTTRDEQVPLGWLTSESVMPGMSGAPVRRLVDDVVVGVISARYNSADGWPRDSVWVTRTEDLQALLVSIDTEVELGGKRPPDGGVDLLLTVSESDVRLAGTYVDISAKHDGVSYSLESALDDVRRERARWGGQRNTVDAGHQVGSLSMQRAGELLRRSFLPDLVANELARQLHRAEQEHVSVRLGIHAPSFTWLPWEAMPVPGDGRPLVLHPLIIMYRKHNSAQAVLAIPGPLRILVAISGPEVGGGPLLDYERELRNVLAAVRGARQGEADVRVVRFATTNAIRSALDEGPAHVLHLSGHGKPGTLVMETVDGSACEINADTFIDEAIPPGHMPPVVSLAACHTAVPASANAPSFAERLVERGACVVIGTESSVTDRYATSLFARVYQELTESVVPDVIGAVADARRVIQRQLATSPHWRDVVLSSLDEWSVVTVLGGAGQVRVYDRAVTDEVPSQGRNSVPGLLTRQVGEFVGRRREQRRLSAELADSGCSGIVLHGIGGVGKTALAAELICQTDYPVVAVVTGELSVEGLLSEVSAVIRRHLIAADEHGPSMRAAEFSGRISETWQSRFAMLRENVFDHVPMLLVLDNFEVNLTTGKVHDSAVAALLAEWVDDPGRSRVLITSRFRFALPGGAESHLRFAPVGPLSMAETFKLIWSLPALDRLDESQLARIWRLVGGHPRALEYMDALLNSGRARFHDVTTRLAKARAERLGKRTGKEDLDTASTEAVILIANDVLLDDLADSLADTAGAQRLLLGASVYREPIDNHALMFQMGEPDEHAAYLPDKLGALQRIGSVLGRYGINPDQITSFDGLSPDIAAEIESDLTEVRSVPRPPMSSSLQLDRLVDRVAATSLLHVNTDSGPIFVHRWTASELDRRWREHGREEELRQAHLRAAEYWKWRVEAWPYSPIPGTDDRDAAVHDVLEARYHYLAAGDVDQASKYTEYACSRLHVVGAWDHETALIHDILARLPAGSPHRPKWLHQLGILAHDRGDYAVAELFFGRSLTDNKRLGNLAATATSHHELGKLAHRQGDYTKAEQHYIEALAIKEKNSNRAGLISCYHSLGVLACDRKYYSKSEQYFMESLSIAEEFDDRVAVAKIQQGMGMLASARGHKAEAEYCSTESLIVAEESDDRIGIAINHHTLGKLAQERRNYGEAERHYAESLTIAEELGACALMATNWSQRGILATDQKEYYTAVIFHARALYLRVELQLLDAFRDVQALTTLRRQLGPSSFTETLREVVEDESIPILIGLLDRHTDLS